jgi:hypothetical protein
MDEGKRESMGLEVIGLVEASIGKVVERRNSILSCRLARSSLASSASEIKEKEKRKLKKKIGKDLETNMQSSLVL